jgi:hypothetical protein
MKSHALLVSAGLLALICLMRFEFARQKEIRGDISFQTWQELALVAVVKSFRLSAYQERLQLYYPAPVISTTV